MRTLTELQAKVLMVIGSSRGAVHPVTISRRTGVKLADVERTCEWAVGTRAFQGVHLAYLNDNSYYGHYDTICRYIMNCDKMRDGA